MLILFATVGWLIAIYALAALGRKQTGVGQQSEGRSRIVFIVMDNQADVRFKVTVGKGVDAKGAEEDVDLAALDITVASSNGNSVAIKLDDNDKTLGTVSFGSPGDAQVVVTIAKKDGTVLEKLDAGFHVTAGDVDKIVGGSIEFTGLAEEPVIPPTPSFVTPATPPVATTGEPSVEPKTGEGGPPAGGVITGDHTTADESSTTTLPADATLVKEPEKPATGDGAGAAVQS